MNNTRRIASRWRVQSAPASSSCSLILIDSTQLKKEEQKKCQDGHKKIEAAQRKLDLHETKSTPEFQKWLNSTFGKELTDIRELTQKVNEAEELVEEVYAESYLTGCSHRQAYEHI